jgi:integrase
MRTRTGCLTKKRGLYYLVISERDPITGKTKRIWMATGQSSRSGAEAKAAELFAPFAARDKADRLAHIAGQVDAAQANATALEDAADPGLTIKDAFDAYERHPDRPDAGEATVDQYRCQWGRFEKWLAKEHPECKTMKQVSPGMACAFMSKLTKEEASPNTFNKYRGFLLMVFRVLAKPGRVTVNPWEAIKPRKLQTAHRRALTVDELRTVCGKATGEMRVLLALGVYTGARLGDCCTMTWANADLARGEIRYSPRKTASRTDGKTLTIPLHPVLAGILAETPAKARRGFILPTYARRYLDKGPASVSQSVQAHFEGCDLATTGEGRGKRQRAAVEVGFHSLRHTAVSMLRDAGASMAAAMAITGHTSAALLDVYTHAGADTVRAAVAALPAIGGSYTPPPSDADKLAKVRELAGTMTPKNWRNVQTAIIQTATA